MKQLADGVWTDTTTVVHLKLQLPATMTVLRLGDGSLLLHSPIGMTPERRAAVDALGRVAHIYSPNTYHHLRVGDWSAAYPHAKVHAPPGLAKKRPDLRIDRVHSGAAEPAFAGVIDELRIDGFRLEETVLYYRPARALIVADLVHNIGKPTHRWTRTYSRMFGFYDRVALSRVIRWVGFSDTVATRRSLDAVLACPFETLIPGHGAPLFSEAHEALAQAYRWLPGSAPANGLVLKPSGCG